MTGEQFITALLAGATVVIAYVQYVLMRRQLEIMERQDTIIEKQLQRGELQGMFAVDSPPNAGNLEIVYSVHNIGPKSVRDFYWHLGIPIEHFLQDSFTLRGQLQNVDAALVDHDGH